MRSLLLIVLVLGFTSCTVDEDRIHEVLSEEGLHDETLTGYQGSWSCSEGNAFNTGFTAYRTVLDREGQPHEQQVDGVVCCTYSTCTVRY